MKSFNKVLLAVLLICYFSNQVSSHLPGGRHELGDTTQIENLVSGALEKVPCGQDGSYHLHRLIGGEKQVVAGMKYYLQIEAACDDNDPEDCEIEILHVPWRKSVAVRKFECN